MGSEAKRVLLLISTLYFDDPTALANFLDRSDLDTLPRPKFMFLIFDTVASGSGREQAECDEKWTDTLASLPQNTRSVTFEIGEYRRSPRKELWILDVLNKRVVREAPGAVRRVTKQQNTCKSYWSEEPQELLSTERHHAFEEVLGDVEE